MKSLCLLDPADYVAQLDDLAACPDTGSLRAAVRRHTEPVLVWARVDLVRTMNPQMKSHQTQVRLAESLPPQVLHADATVKDSRRTTNLS